MLYAHDVGITRNAYGNAGGYHHEIALGHESRVERAVGRVAEQIVGRRLHLAERRHNAPIHRELIVRLFGRGGRYYRRGRTEARNFLQQRFKMKG